MNSVWVIVLGSVLFFWGYRFYCKKLEQLWQINPKNPTPANTKFDGVDFVPAKNWLVLFGHNFSSIAGAGPIIGPVIACVLWGWLPALIWIVFGTIFIGGVHDFGALITSVREGGSSIADIADETISRRAKIIFSCFVWLTLVLVIAVFTYLCADTFVKEPKIVLPSLGLIPVAMLIGFLLYYLKANATLTTIFGLVLLTGLILWGNVLPIKLGNNSGWVWSIILLVYCFFASVLPVNILLQPRDYLSSFLLFAGVAFGYLGLFILHPKISSPVYVNWKAQEGGYLWPMLCVTIACGAISGFHSLVASGTTSKQIANESDVKKISYGGMVAEGLVAILAVLAISAGLSPLGLASALKSAGPIRLFGLGYNELAKPILGGFGVFIAITILNAFILTTLDTATRICRYITEELTGIKNRYFSTFIVVLAGGSLALSGKWSRIWPVFGASNQLVAALALMVLTAWLFCKGKTLRFTFIPAIFMVTTTIAALIYQSLNYYTEKDYFLFAVSLILIALAVFMIIEAYITFRKRLLCPKV